MTSTPREIGTLIIVIDKANHLPNKRHIGKQDPYCSVEFEGRKGRTKTIKRGGQHPEWDEELRFPVYEDVEDELARTASDERAPSPPPKDGTPNSKPSSLRGKKSRSKKAFKLACYADDVKEPELIGETMVDLSTVLSKGEQDEWYTLMYKDKFAGKVYVELTFYSNEKPPAKPAKVKLPTDYVGPGDFKGEDKPSRQPRTVSTPHQFPRDSRTALRNPSGSFPELYTPPYDRSTIASVTSELSQLSMSHSIRRESFPPINGQSHTDGVYQPRHSMSLPMDQGYGPEPGPPYSTPPPTAPSALYHAHQAPYEPSATPGFAKSSIRGPRYSVPTSSSGFVPLNQSRALPSHPSEPSGFAPTLSHTPAPSVYGGSTPAPPSLYNASYFAPPSSFTPMPSQTPIPHSSSGMMTYPPPQQYSYSHYPPAAAPPPQQYLPHTPPHPSYAPYPTEGSPSPPNDIPASASLSSSHGPGGSRPLPQPQGAHGAQYPPPIPGQPGFEYANPSSNIVFPTGNGYPPPPPPPLQSNNSPPRSPHQHYQEQQQYQEQHYQDSVQQYQEPGQQQYQEPTHQQYHDASHPELSHSHSQSSLLPPPPPPPPISHYEPRQPQRRASLPQPPQVYSQRGALPIPPPPPADFYQSGHLHPAPPMPPSHLGVAHSYIPGPPPRPPQLDADGQWVPPQAHPPAGWA